MAVINVQPLAVGIAETVASTQVNATPQPSSLIFINTDDTSATVTATGYLNASKALYGNMFINGQLAVVYTTDNGQSAYQIRISGANTSLIPEVNPGTVVLPVVSGNFVNFDGTTGILEDAGFAPSDADEETVVMMHDVALAEGNFAVFRGTNGTIEDAAYSPSDESKTKVVMASAAVLANHIACFSDTAGTVNDDAATAINAGNIQAGLSGTAGALASFPATVTTGSFITQATSNSGAFNTVLTNNALGQTTTFRLPDPGAASAGILVSTLTAPDNNANLIRFDVTVTAAALAAGSSVTLFASSGAKQYQIINLWVNAGGTNFSGGGGDRLLSIKDNVTTYSIVPAASLQTLANTTWGATGLPFPAGGVALNTSTAAGAFIVARYSGGTGDYGAGSVVISGLLQRVA